MNLEINIGQVGEPAINPGAESAPKCTPGSQDRCANARTSKCACACGGANHGGHMRDKDAGRCMDLTPAKVFNGPCEQTMRTLAPGADMDIRLWRDPSGQALVNIPQSLVLHSPTGFEWGYGGSGPADLALNILNLYVKPPEAWRLHQAFKQEVIARMPREGGIIRAGQVKAWIGAAWALQDKKGTS